MFYSNETIADMGYADVDDFVCDYVRKHPNCSIMFVSNGVLADYDFDSELGLQNAGEICQTLDLPILNIIISPTVEQVRECRLRNNYPDADTSLIGVTDKDLRGKVLLENGALGTCTIENRSVFPIHASISREDLHLYTDLDMH